MEHKKYPRTFHLPNSLSITSDDKKHLSTDQFIGKEVIITEKLDGENTTIYSGGTHARSLDGRNHPSRSWMKAFAANNRSNNLAENEKICGEYLYAQHSIAYDNLETYFYGFAWFVDDVLQSWDATVKKFESLEIMHVPILWRGVFDENILKTFAKTMDLNTKEGYVLRVTDTISPEEFSKFVGKFVRAKHVQTDKHWMHSEIIPNKLSG